MATTEPTDRHTNTLALYFSIACTCLCWSWHVCPAHQRHDDDEKGQQVDMTWHDIAWHHHEHNMIGDRDEKRRDDTIRHDTTHNTSGNERSRRHTCTCMRERERCTERNEDTWCSNTNEWMKERTNARDIEKKERKSDQDKRKQKRTRTSGLTSEPDDDKWIYIRERGGEWQMNDNDKWGRCTRRDEMRRDERDEDEDEDEEDEEEVEEERCTTRYARATIWFWYLLFTHSYVYIYYIYMLMRSLLPHLHSYHRQLHQE